MDIIEADHILPRSKGGPDRYSNLQALHKHCHVQKNLRDSSVSIDFAFSSMVLGREPDEGKLSRPDRKTGV